MGEGAGLSGAGSDAFRASIARDVIDRNNTNRRRRSTDEVERIAEPDEKPDPHAQWDEVRGVWILWDEDAKAWVDLETDEPKDEES